MCQDCVNKLDAAIKGTLKSSGIKPESKVVRLLALSAEEEILLNLLSFYDTVVAVLKEKGEAAQDGLEELKVAMGLRLVYKAEIRTSSRMEKVIQTFQMLSDGNENDRRN